MEVQRFVALIDGGFLNNTIYELNSKPQAIVKMIISHLHR